VRPAAGGDDSRHAKRPRRCAAWLLALLAGFGVDTSDGLPRQAVSGAVTLDGRLLPRGTIQFSPSSGASMASLIAIKDGRYSVAREQGLVPGPYKVLISCHGEEVPTKAEETPGLPGSLPKEILPAAAAGCMG
jgi:hypothetical protein